jgi:hypothetical protein
MIPDLVSWIATFGKMAGVATLIVMLINLAAFLGLFKKEGQKATANTILQLVALLGLYLVKVVWPDLDLWLVDQYAQQLADLGVALAPFIPLVLKFTPAAHDAMAGKVPVLGFSRSEGDKSLPQIVAP